MRLRGRGTSWRLVGLYAAIVLVATACGGAATGSTAPAPSTSSAAATPVPTSSGESSEAPLELTKVRVAFNPGTVVQLYAAIGNDLFKKHGLDVELIQFESGAATNAAFASGGVDLGYSGVPGILASRLAGAGTRIFMLDNEGGGAAGLVVTQGSGIKSVRDLPGKTIGTVIGTTAWLALTAALEAEGIDPTTVDIKNVAPSAWVPAFANNDLDGIWGWAPLIFMMEQEHGGTLIARDRDYVDTPLFWQARGTFIDEHPETVEAFIAAYDEAVTLVESKDPKFIATMIEMTGVTEPYALATIDGVTLIPLKEMVSADGQFSMTNPDAVPKYISDTLDRLVAAGILTERPDLTGLTDPMPIQTYLAR